MQQAPEYQEQGQLRREYTPQQPNVPQSNVPYERQAVPEGVAASRQESSLSWRDWVRWGPIWSGWFIIIATLIVIGSLGSAIGFTVWGAGVPVAFSIGWSIFTGVIAYLLGGWVTVRSASVRGIGPAVLNSTLTWALSLVAFVVAIAARVSTVVGMGVVSSTPAGASGNVATAAWTTFVTTVIGLILVIIGGLLGARSMPAMRGRRTM